MPQTMENAQHNIGKMNQTLKKLMRNKLLKILKFSLKDFYCHHDYNLYHNLN